MRLATCLTAVALLLLARPAEAHLPHEWLLGLAADGDFAASGQAWAILAVDGSLDGIGWWPMVSRDGGRHWDPSTHPPTRANIEGLAVWAGGALIPTVTGELWAWSEAGWLLHDSPTLDINEIVANNAHVAIASGNGVFVADDPAGPWTQILYTPASGVAFDAGDPDALVVTQRDGVVLLGSTAVLVPVESPPSAPMDVAMSEGVVYTGAEGAVYRFTPDGWEACGALPVSDLSLDYAARVTRLWVAPGLIMAGTGQLLYTSTDGCVSFTEEDVFGEVAEYAGGTGTADSPSSSFSGFAVGEVSVAAGYRGLSWRAPSGPWQGARVLDSSFVRAIDTRSGESEGAPGLWATSYGGGLLELADGGGSIYRAGPGETLESAFGRDVGVGGPLVYAGDLYAYTSADNGVTLSTAEVLTDHLVGLRTAGGLAWALGAPGSSGAMTRSVDGVTWIPVALPAGYPLDVSDATVDGVSALLVRTTSPAGIYLSTDGGARWVSLGSDTSDVSGVVSWPPGEGSRIVRSGSGGVSWSEDSGATWVPATVPPDLPPGRLGASAELGILGFDSSGQLWRSVDGGERWSSLAEPLISPQDWLIWRDILIVATLRGVYWSVDVGATWVLAPFRDHLDNHHDALRCGDASGGVVGCTEVLTPGNTLSFSTRAHRLLVTADEPLELEVVASGVGVGRVYTGEEVELPPAGWSDVTLTVTDGLGTVSLVEGWLEGEALDLGGDTDTATETGEDTQVEGEGLTATRPEGETGGDSAGEDSDGCGSCSTTGGAAPPALLVALLLGRSLVVRRQPPTR